MSILHANLTILDAIAHPRLFRPWFKDEASWIAWRTFLAALFALPMSDAELAIFSTCTGRTDPPSRQAREAWLCVGRRGGKSLALAALAVFVGCFGDFRKYVVPGESLKIPVLAADREQAGVIANYCRAMLTEIPMLRKMLKRALADSFELTNGLTISVQTASFRGARGFTAPLVLCDEIAFWYSEDSGSANPDTEILRALRPSLGTIPNSMLICASSPYAKKGALYDAFKRYYGQAGDVLAWKAPTWVMHPPDAKLQGDIDDAYASDPEAASAEWGAEFRSDISSFIQREVVETAIDRGVYERPWQPGKRYRAFCDPSGGSSDSFTLAVAHHEKDAVILDCTRDIKAPFVPTEAVAQIAATLKSYRLFSVVGDKYAAQWTVDAFRQAGVTYNHSKLSRSEIYAELLPALNAGKVRLLDMPRAVSQICNLERRTARGGRDSIDHPPGAHDDLANSIAGVATLVSERSLPREGSEPLDVFFSRMNPENYRYDPATGRHRFQPPTVWTPWGT
jgi:hypothetical protein